MAAQQISELFQFGARYVRSVHLERDFADPSALQGYVVTPQTRAHLERLSQALQADSSQRAWRITGDYGSGKSSFALALAHALSGKKRELPDDLRQVLDFKARGISRPQLLPVLVTGAREPIAAALLRALRQSLESTIVVGASPKVLRQIRALCEREELPNDDEVLRLLEETNKYLRFTDKATGVLVLLDELGKFLEFAAMNPDRQDIFFLQRLAEMAARSGDAQLVVVGILHQGFHAYAEQLSQSAQREWEKVAGRFEELLFSHPLQHTAHLVSQALGIRERMLPKGVADQAAADMGEAIQLGWYGADAAKSSLTSTARRLYPLHPTVLPVLVRLLSRFGQNERSLFSFLLSTEPFGLMSFADRPAKDGSFYRLSDLYDYARSTFGHRLSVQSYRSHWNQIESMVESLATDDDVELRIVKTVAILNLIDADGLLPSEEAICLAVSGTDTSAHRPIRAALTRLQKSRRILYHRGASGGFCLWPHTSVNLEKAYEQASSTLGSIQRVAPLLTEHLETRPIVARRHYIKTGNLRYFDIEYRSVDDAAKPLPHDRRSDGTIVVFLVETEEERAAALKHARSAPYFGRADVMVAVPRPLHALAGLVQEANRWKWISQNTPDLNHDKYAAEEVTKQIASAERTLAGRLQSVLGLRQLAGHTELEWFRKGKREDVADGRDLLSRLSDVFDEVYAKAPRIPNELVNRQQLSSAAAAARMRLIERAFTDASNPLLGMDPEKKPPEMSIYLSVLQRSGIHRQVGDGMGFAEPPPEDPCNLQPSFDRLMQVLRDRHEEKVKASELFAELYSPPFGVREGVAPLLLAALAIIHEHELAFYENGSFVRQLSGGEFLRLVKAPANFEVQYCQVSGVRSALFEQLMRVLLPNRPARTKPDVLDVVRPLCVFAAQLPVFTQRTQRLSQHARDVRSALVSGREPAPLLFKDLPKACGFEPFSTSGSTSEQSRAAKFVSVLKAALDELKAAYPELLQDLERRLARAFEIDRKVRESLRGKAEHLLVAVSEPQLKALCLRLADTALGDTEWIESLGSLVCSKPPSKWLDADVDTFAEELQRLAHRLRRVEAVVFSKGKMAGTRAFRVAITRPDGTEVDQVLHVSTEQEASIAKVEEHILGLIKRETRTIGIAAVSRVIWKVLEASDKAEERS